MSLISVDEASVVFSRGPAWNRQHFNALQPVSLKVEKGEVLGLVGESGSGKSTLGHVMLGLQAPTQGDVHFNARSLKDLSRKDRAGRFAAVLQHPLLSLNPMMKIAESVLEPLRIAGKAPSDTRSAHRIAGAMLERVGLSAEYLGRLPRELSGGQRQRVSIARALITQPDFVLFDEAVSALDVSVQAQILNLLRSLQKEQGFAALFISHDLAATRYVSTNIAVLYAGSLVELAPAASFHGLAKHPYSRGLQLASGLTSDPSLQLKVGAMVDQTSLPGCPLCPRCPVAIDICSTERPERAGAGRTSACHLSA